MVGRKTTLVLSSLIETTNDQGEIVNAWADIEYLTGVLSRNSGREQFVDGKWRVNSDYTFSIEPSKKYTITEKYKMRIPKESREFDIVSVDNTFSFLKIQLLERK